MGFLDFFKKKQILVSTEDDKIMQNLPEIKAEFNLQMQQNSD